MSPGCGYRVSRGRTSNACYRTSAFTCDVESVDASVSLDSNRQYSSPFTWRVATSRGPVRNRGRHLLKHIEAPVLIPISGRVAAGHHRRDQLRQRVVEVVGHGILHTNRSLSFLSPGLFLYQRPARFPLQQPRLVCQLRASGPPRYVSTPAAGAAACRFRFRRG